MWAYSNGVGMIHFHSDRMCYYRYDISLAADCPFGHERPLIRVNDYNRFISVKGSGNDGFAGIMLLESLLFVASGPVSPSRLAAALM